MITAENNSTDEMGEEFSSKKIISNRIYAFLTIVGFLSTIVGFIITLIILVDSSQDSNILYPHGFLIGLLLLSGGVILIVGTIILRKGSKNNTSNSFTQR